MEIIHKNDTVVLIGETGCGKSTQVPQYCIRIGLAKYGRVGVTQPRRLAAVSLANRVAKEVGTTLGLQVGYHVRFEREVSETTEIVYLTDGILLREAIHDPLLREYNIIIVDEAHERSLHTDILLNVLRLCQRQRNESDLPRLRIVIMSATLEAELFSSYFNNAPVFVIKGQTFPVEIFHAEINPENSDYLFNSLVCIKDLHQEEPLEDHFLVFLTGREEIECAARKLRELNKHFENPIYPVPLFAALSSSAQLKAFEPPPTGHRKVVLATNIAETSLTIPGIRVVIDSGKKYHWGDSFYCSSSVQFFYILFSILTFTACDRIDVLRVHDVSKAQAVQRAGRAGREAPGKCYRLYPVQHFEKLEPCSVPEILRSNLSAVILEMLAMGLHRPKKLKLMQQPDHESIDAAVLELKALGAVTLEGKNVVMTPMGHTLCKFPLSPDQASFIVTASDHLSVLNVIQAFRREKQKNASLLKEWCKHNYVNFKNLSMVLKIRKQLREIAQECGMRLVSCGGKREKLRQALACGLFMNVCEYDRQEDRYRLLVKPRTTLKIHPSSALSRSQPRHIVFTDLMRTTDLYARDVSIIDYEWVQPIIQRYKNNMETE
ncbi:helicase protein [Dictyocaulus viviparus]|uniref:RNA helicase n=1 Tax=Dictyocaulus viviparus TaxID=29172 RepID=A0A0D8Y2R5_DICVI|nr:helicase protein [Dictyocaulus viviparus]